MVSSNRSWFTAECCGFDELVDVWEGSEIGVDPVCGAGFRSFFLRFRGLMIRGRHVSEEDDDDADELVVPELGPLSSLATEWASLG